MCQSSRGGGRVGREHARQLYKQCSKRNREELLRRETAGSRGGELYKQRRPGDQMATATDGQKLSAGAGRRQFSQSYAWMSKDGKTTFRGVYLVSLATATMPKTGCPPLSQIIPLVITEPIKYPEKTFEHPKDRRMAPCTDLPESFV